VLSGDVPSVASAGPDEHIVATMRDLQIDKR
jgi:hypothetical protein